MVLPIESKLNITGFIDSRQGGRTENQDSAGVRDTPLGTLVIVCDGMGRDAGRQHSIPDGSKIHSGIYDAI